MRVHIKTCQRLYSTQKILKANQDFDLKSLNQIRLLRKELFENEKIRQKSLITRIEKIKVDIKGPPEECVLIMNKGVSTPFNCAQHIHEYVTKKCALALVNGKPWDIHKPLVEDCEIHFLHFKDQDPRYLNKAFWRTGSFILGYVLENSFKASIFPELYGWPSTDVAESSFAYDCILPFEHEWIPSLDEYRILTRKACEICWHEYPIEPLTMDAKAAMKILADSKHKVAQIPMMAAESASGNTVTLYKFHDHVDISRGPMVSNTRLFGRFDIVNLHALKDTPYPNMYRAQGVALPLQLSLHQWTWNLVKKKASKPNDRCLPQRVGENGLALQNKVHTEDPPSVVPDNLGWKQLHISTDTLAPGKRPSSVHAEQQDIQGGRLVDGGNELKFNRLRHKWGHAPVFKDKAPSPSMYVNSINKVPKQFVTIPNGNEKKSGENV